MKSLKISTLTAAIALVMGLVCCSKNRPDGSKNLGQESGSTSVSQVDVRDQKFLAKAVEINLVQIELGILANQNASIDDMKDLGLLAAKDHSQAMERFKLLAKRKVIPIPTYITGQYKDLYYKLHVKYGKDFDQNYCNIFITIHKDLVILFEKAANESTDPDIKSLALATLPTLKNLLDRGLICQELIKMDQIANSTAVK